MRLLVDTHIFLWYITGDARLSEHWKTLLRDPDNEVFLSVVSVWEVSIKYRLGKLPLPDQPETFLPEQRRKHNFAPLALEENAVRHLANFHPCTVTPSTECSSARLWNTS